jgi:ribonuclease VapC
MFVDACAIVALLADEREAQRVSDALSKAKHCFTSPIAVLEVVLALSRPDKFNRPVADVEPLVIAFLESRNIAIKDLPPAPITTRLALHAAHTYRAGRNGLNLADCLHYACAKHFDVGILATDQEFVTTDLVVV